MSAWENTKLGRKRTLGVLTISLFREPDDGVWSLFIYLRLGVVLGVPRPHSPRLAKLEFAWESEADAEKVAERLAADWFIANCEDLIAGKEFSV